MRFENEKTKKFMLQKLYKIKCSSGARSLFEDVVYSNQYDAFKDALTEDFYNKRVLLFSDPSNKRKYIRHYPLIPRGGIVPLVLGHYFDGRFENALVVINLRSKQYDPFLAILEYKPAFNNADQVARLLSRAFNYAFNGRGLMVEFEPWDLSNVEDKYFWIADCVICFMEAKRSIYCNYASMFGFEMIEELFLLKNDENKKKPRKLMKSNKFKDYINIEDKDKLLKWLHKEMDDKEHPIDMMRPHRGVQDFGLLGRPTIEAFKKEFPKLKSLIGRSTYDGYTDTEKDPYGKEETYKGVKQRIKAKFKREIERLKLF